MNMTYLYNKEGLEQINKEKKTNMFLFILFASLFAVALIVFVVVSSYKTRLLWSILSSVVCSIFIVLFFFFLSKYLYLKRIENEYKTLLETENKKIKCVILTCSDFITTLPDKSRCYEVLIKKDDKEVIYYLSEIFDREVIKEGQCTIITSFDYLKGYQYED